MLHTLVPSVSKDEQTRLNHLIDALSASDKDSDEEGAGQDQTQEREKVEAEPYISSRPPPGYSCRSSVQRWAYEVAGIDIDSLEGGDALAHDLDHDNWSEVSGFGPEDYLAARNHQIERVNVVFSDNLDGVLMTEQDPVGMFLHEARHMDASV